MKLSFLAIIFALMITTCLGQKSESVNVEFDINGKRYTKKRFTLWIHSGQKVIEVQGYKGRFIIPEKLKTIENMDVRLKIGKFDLSFLELAPKYFDNKWIVGIDSPPFEAIEEKLPIKNGKNPTMLYYVEYHPRNAEAIRESSARY